MQRLADDLRQPTIGRLAEAANASLALLEGRFDDAEDLVESARRLGELSHPWDAIVFSQIQRFALRREDGRLAELEPSLRRAVEDFPTRPIFGCLLAVSLVEVGDVDAARQVFEGLAAEEFAGIPFNNDFLFSLSQLTEVAWMFRDPRRAASLYRLLLPHAGMVVDMLESSDGAVDRYLGLAAETTGDLDAAEGHLRDALELNERIGALPWTVRTQRDLARLLFLPGRAGDRRRAVELLRTALEVANRLGMTIEAGRIAEDLAQAGEVVASPDTGRADRAGIGPMAKRSVLRCEGEYWTIVYGDDSFKLRDAKGFLYLSQLLRHPGQEFHALDLIAIGRGIGTGPRPGPEDNLRNDGLSDSGPVLDERAKSAYRLRFRDLEDELDEAMAWSDSDRVSRIREEMQSLADELSSAVGLGGRDRRVGSAAERARVNVTRAVKTLLARIRQHSPALASHLDATVHTGTFCSYSPDPRSPFTWHT
jgi:tetratricopeptide (TPR) repeat protein